jgi:hypothetical protein
MGDAARTEAEEAAPEEARQEVKRVTQEDACRHIPYSHELVLVTFGPGETECLGLRLNRAPTGHEEVQPGHKTGKKRRLLGLRSRVQAFYLRFLSLRGQDLNLRPLGYEFCISGSAQAYPLLRDHVRCS